MASPPLVAVVDTSPGPGGAVTSILALEESVRARGMRTVVIARVPSAFRDLAPNLHVIDLGADDLSAVRGRAYAAPAVGLAGEQYAAGQLGCVRGGTLARGAAGTVRARTLPLLASCERLRGAGKPHLYSRTGGRTLRG